MIRFSLTFDVALATLICLSAVACHRIIPPRAASTNASPTPRATDFQPTGVIDMFMEYYKRPLDGAVARFGCSDRASEAKALMLIRTESSLPLIERTNVTDSSGAKIGERVVWDSQPLSWARVEWNEHARLFSIWAPSLQDALTFEKSKAWQPSGCWDAHSW
jgi:hypothetical protein